MRDRVDADDVHRAGVHRALHRVGAHAAEADDDDGVAGPHPAGVDRRAPAGGHAAGDQRRGVQRHPGVDLHAGELAEQRVPGEGADHAEPAERLAVQPERERAGGQLPAGDRGALVAEVGPARRAEPAVPAGGQEAGDDVVAGRDGGDARAHGLDDAGALVPADDRVAPARVGVPQVLVGVAQAGVGHLDQHLARARVEHLELDDLVLGLRLAQHRCSGPHPAMLPRARRTRPHRPLPARAPGARVRHHRRSARRRPPSPTEVCPGCGAVLVPVADDAPGAPRRLPVLRAPVRGDAAAGCARRRPPTPAPPPSSRLADAAYDAQHPAAGDPDRLRAALDRLGRARGDARPRRGPRPPPWRTTIADVAADLDVIDLAVLVESWARSVHEDWTAARAARHVTRLVRTAHACESRSVSMLQRWVISVDRRARKKAQTRELIRTVAHRLFAERGFDAVTIADIAREADVAVQTVFNHFATKEELFFDGPGPLGRRRRPRRSATARPGVAAADRAARLPRRARRRPGRLARAARSGAATSPPWRPRSRCASYERELVARGRAPPRATRCARRGRPSRRPGTPPTPRPRPR